MRLPMLEVLRGKECSVLVSPLVFSSRLLRRFFFGHGFSGFPYGRSIGVVYFSFRSVYLYQIPSLPPFHLQGLLFFLV
jgi:hypothetical protein